MITIAVTNKRAAWPVNVTERQAEELFAKFAEIDRIDCPRCYYVRDHKRRRLYSRPPSADRGWVPYPFPPDGVGNMVTHLDTIIRLVGSMCYESCTQDGRVYIRRID